MHIFSSFQINKSLEIKESWLCIRVWRVFRRRYAFMAAFVKTWKWQFPKVAIFAIITTMTLSKHIVPDRMAIRDVAERSTSAASEANLYGNMKWFACLAVCVILLYIHSPANMQCSTFITLVGCVWIAIAPHIHAGVSWLQITRWGG